MRATLALAALLLAGCDLASLTAPRDRQPMAVSLAAADWRHDFGTGILLAPSPPAWRFDFPSAPGAVHYVSTRCGDLSAASTLRVVVEVDADRAVYEQLDPADVGPATAHAYIQRHDDDLRSEYGRWWATEALVLPTDGREVLALDVPLRFEAWTSVYGRTDREQFAAALRNAGRVGLTFGGQHFYGHGVRVASGTARLHLLDYRVSS